MLAKKVWDTFRKVKVFENNRVEKKGQFSYLSWAAAVEILNDNFPDNDIDFSQFVDAQGNPTIVNYYPDGTGEVVCKITIREDGAVFERSQSLPILDYKNNPIRNANAMAVNTAKQRCMVKCLAMMGLGLHVYQGAEDDPVYTPSEDVNNNTHPRNEDSQSLRWFSHSFRPQHAKMAAPQEHLNVEAATLCRIMGWDTAPDLNGGLLHALAERAVEFKGKVDASVILKKARTQVDERYQKLGGIQRKQPWPESVLKLVDRLGGKTEDSNDLVGLCRLADALDEMIIAEA